MSLTYITITESFVDGTGAPLSANVTLTPSQAVYAGGVPVVTPAQPVVAEVVGGQLLNSSGGPLQLLANVQAGLTLMSGTGFWWWTASVQVGQVTDSWSFQLAASPSSVELYSTKNTPAGSAGVTSFNGRTGAVTLAKADVTGTGLAAADVGALPASGGALTGELSPGIVTLTDAATVVIGAAGGNDWRLLLTSAIGSTRAIGAPTGLADGATYTLALTQPASGGPCSVTWNAVYDFGSAGAPTLSTAASAADIIAFKYYGGGVAKLRCLGSGTGF
jgi:hypothetical protein